jgi:hypothetical protein
MYYFKFKGNNWKNYISLKNGNEKWVAYSTGYLMSLDYVCFEDKIEARNFVINENRFLKTEAKYYLYRIFKDIPKKKREKAEIE